jgi:hypothetical protein
VTITVLLFLYLASNSLLLAYIKNNNNYKEFVNSTESEVCGLPTSLKNETIITTAMPLPTPKPITPPSSPKPLNYECVWKEIDLANHDMLIHRPD